MIAKLLLALAILILIINNFSLIKRVLLRKNH